MSKRLGILILLGLIALSLYACGKDIELISQNWSYEDGICKGDFILKNNMDNFSTRKVRTVAHRQRNIGKGAVVNDILGEKVLHLGLRPHEIVEKTEPIDLIPNLRPSMIIVNHFEPK